MAYTALDRPDAQANRRRVLILAAASLVLFAGLIAAYFVKQQFGGFDFGNGLPFRWLRLPRGSVIVKTLMDMDDRQLKMRSLVAECESDASWTEICASVDQGLRKQKVHIVKSGYDPATADGEDYIFWGGTISGSRRIGVGVVRSRATSTPGKTVFNALEMEMPDDNSGNVPDLLKQRQGELERDALTDQSD